MVTRFGDWGAGVNGGGWLVINGRRADFLYRSLRHVREVIERCCEEKADAVYQLGHPLGFQNQIHLGETHCCQTLYDLNGELAALKKLAVLVYRVLSGDLIYNDPGANAYHQLNRARELKSLRKRAKLLGFELVDRSSGEVLLNPVS